MRSEHGHGLWLLGLVLVATWPLAGWAAENPGAAGPWEAIGDPLDHDNGRWTMSSGTYFEGGAYHVTKPTVTWAYAFSDGIAQIEAQHVSGVPNMAFGLAFRFSANGPGGGPAGYYVRITANGVWALVRMDGFHLTYVIPPHPSNVLTTGDGNWNTIGVVCRGNVITVLLNGLRAGTATDGTYRAGGVGPVSVTGKLEAAFRDLTIDPAYTLDE